MSILALLGISDAYAETAAPAHAQTASGSLLSFLPMIVIFGVVMFFMIRQQTKRSKDHRALVSSLAIGDEVITAGGILAKISKVHDNFVSLKLTDNVEINFQKSSIAQVLPKGTIESLN